jgi:hypothetical protein
MKINLQLLHLINMCWNKLQIPNEWLDANTIPIFNKGDKSTYTL